MIRYFFIIFLVLLPANALAYLDYQLDVQLIPAEQRLIATAVIHPDKSLPQEVKLRLAKTAEIIAVHQTGININYLFEGGILELELVDLKPISISYRARFADQVSETPIHNEDPSYGVSAVISDNGAFLSAAADWYPRLKSENIHYKLSIEAPPGFEAVTSGRRVFRDSGQNRSLSTWEIDYPLHGLTLSAGPYQVFEDSTGRVPIYAYFYAGSAHLATGYLQEARNYLNLYEELFGSYPFQKFAIVENFFPTGYGFPSWTLLGSSVIRLPFIIKTSLGHEIAHSWWGTGVRVDYSQGNWAEGLTTYVADYLYKERESEAAALEYRLKVMRDYAGLVGDDNDFPLAQFASRNDKASQAIGYGKAAMLFHMLRKQIGDEKFWSVLKEIAQENMFQRVGWSDFAEQFSTACDNDLTAFFTQWLQRTAGPKISLQNVTLEKTAEGYSLRGFLQQAAPYYQLTTELQIITADGTSRQPISITGKVQEFQVSSVEQPSALIVDPSADLFRILAKEEIPPTINALRGSSDLLLLNAEDYAPTPEAVKTLLGALRKGNLPIQNMTDISAAELAKHDLLIFGASNTLKPGILTAGKVFLAGEEADLNGKSALVVLPHPTAKNRISAWFVSADRQEDAVVARKIPHYGKYSYLLFDGATNRIKGTFPPAKSPLKIDFTEQVKH